MVVLCLLMIVSGCKTTEELRDASAKVAIAAAPTVLPEWPVQCLTPMPTVVPGDTDKWRWVQKRWEIVRENENKTKAWCTNFYEQVKQNVGKGVQ